jgi:O-antigen/teichoic acid export membrane protein
LAVAGEVSIKECPAAQPSAQAAPTVGSRAARGALWQMLGGGWLSVVRLGASTMLARALEPSDFGLFGMALLAQEIVVVIGNLGMSTGLIAKSEVTEDDLCTCFWTMAGARLLMFVVAFSGAPLAALFFHDPRVTDVLRVVSFTFLLAPLTDVANALLRKELKFGFLTCVQSVAALLESATAVVLAVSTDLGYWALVAGILVNTVATNLGMLLGARWWPRLRFSRESFRYQFRFGIHGLGFGVANYLNQNIDYLLVGRILGPTSLGMYEFAYRIPHLVLDRIARPVGTVAFPALAKLQDDERLIAAYVKVVTMTSLISFPVLVGLAAIADMAVRVLWGEKWLPIVLPLQILCVSGAARTIIQPVGAIFNCKNRPDLPFKFTAVMTLVTFAVVASLGRLYGVVGVAAGMTVALAPLYFVLRSAFRLAGARTSELLSALVPASVSSLAMGACAYLAKEVVHNLGANHASALIAGVLAGVLVYPLALRLLFADAFESAMDSARAVLGRA